MNVNPNWTPYQDDADDAPDYLLDLKDEAEMYWRRTGHDVPNIELCCCDCSRLPQTTGWCALPLLGDARVVLHLGRSKRDQRLALLHELAHIFANSGHSTAMYCVVWELYREFGVNLVYARKREFKYQPRYAGDAYALVAQKHHKRRIANR